MYNSIVNYVQANKIMAIININFLLKITTSLFILGLLGLVLNRKNVLMSIVSLELMLLAVNLNFIFFSIYLDDILGQVFVIFVLTIAAAESAIGLAILAAFYRLQNSIEFKLIKIGKVKI